MTDTHASTWCSTAGINHFGRLVSIILKIRKSVFPVFQHFFSGRRSTVDLVNCKETQSQVLSINLQGVTKNQAVRKTTFIFIQNQRANYYQQWLVLNHLMIQHYATDIQIKTENTSSHEATQLPDLWTQMPRILLQLPGILLNCDLICLYFIFGGELQGSHAEHQSSHL